VIELPAALAPWAGELALLSTDLALTLAPWVGRLAVAIGDLSENRTSRTAEPDGYGGLARRGPYERLVTTEWALAELYPDEFLRRAAAGEHLFLDLTRRGPRRAQRSIAVVSAGPSQLGAPRLAHLAALIVLSRRAAASGAAFSWGVLEDAAHGLGDGLDAGAIRRLLDARTAAVAGAGAIDTWRTAIDDGADRGDADWWLIGGPELVPAARRAGAACLAVRDLLEPDARAIEIEVHRRGPTARLRLELPAPDVCARLLRDPLRRGGATRVAPAPAPAITVRFSAPAGSSPKLLVQLAGGDLQCWPVPSSPRDRLGQPHRCAGRPREWMVAVGVRKRGVLAVTASPDDPSAVKVAYGGHRDRVQVVLPGDVAQRLDERMQRRDLLVGTCGLVQLRPAAPVDLVIEVAGCLVVVHGFTGWPPAPVMRASLLWGSAAERQRAQLVTSELRAHSAQWALVAESDRYEIIRASESGAQRVATAPLDPGGPPSPRVVFGFHHPQQARWGPVACEVRAEEWLLVRPDGPPMHLSAGRSHVVGGGWCDGRPGLVVQRHEHQLRWQRRDGHDDLPPATAEIMTAAVCPQRALVAWVTRHGEVVVYSLEHRAVLMRLLPAAGPP